MSDPLVNHLIDLVEAAPTESFIVVGGLGMMLKRAHLLKVQATTLVSPLPEARATADIDIYLRIKLFLQPTLRDSFRSTVDDLGYVPRVKNWQFEKLLNPTTGDLTVTLDLLSREPIAGEAVRRNPLRVGQGVIHGRTTPEAFAVEHSPISIQVHAETRSAQISVPHPYNWIIMKVRAAYDWLLFDQGATKLREGQQAPSAKHAFDVVLLVAMMTEEELDSSRAVRESFTHLEIARSILEEAITLYETETSRGWLEAMRGGATGIEHALVWETLQQVLGIEV